jgi:hypothetical protein
VAVENPAAPVPGAGRERVLIVMIADVPAPAVAAFQEYESRVLPLLDRHGGRLERRLRGDGGQVEVHVVSFGSRAGYESYLADPQRTGHRQLLAGAEISQRILEMEDVR